MKNKGWYGQRQRHSMASKGIKSGNMKSCENKDHSILFSKNTIELSNKIADLQEKYWEASDELESAIRSEAFKIFHNPRDEFDNYFIDNIKKYDNEHPYEVIMNYYNISNPFHKGDKVWDKDLQTWFHVVRNVNGYKYIGYYFNEHGKKINYETSYRTLRRE